VKLRALSAGEVIAEFGCRLDAAGLPVRRDVADLIRRFVTAKGTLSVDSLLEALVGLTSPNSPPSDPTTTRLRSVLAQMRAAGEVRVAGSTSGTLCWLAPPAAVGLPDGRVLLLGQDGAAEDAATTDDLYPGGASPDAKTLADHLGPPGYRFELKGLGLAGWRHASPEDLNATLAATPGHAPQDVELSAAARQWTMVPPFRATVLTPQFEALPEQVRRALAIAGTPIDDALAAWRLPLSVAAELDLWVGRPDLGDADDDPVADVGQERVLEAQISDRLIVEAGPGSGKTRVACGRVARLIDSGAAPTRIFMISFTQAAVGELRDRIGSFLADSTYAGDVQISTLDSIAGGFRSGFGQEEPPAGFEAGISEALALITAGDRGLLGFLGTLEHLVVDEAQDLNGDRGALVEALIHALPTQCGVTLFEDSAQAIYGWDGNAGPSLSSKLLASPALAFSQLALQHDHRTRNPDLRDLKSQLRKALSSGLTPEGAYHAVRAAIEAVAKPSTVLSQPGSIPRSTLVLFRGRGELLSAASRFWREGLPARVRLTRRSKSVTPWVGAMLRGSEAKALSRDVFDLVWRDLWPQPASLSAEEAWHVLRSVAGAGPRGGVDLERLERRINTSSPPLALALSSTGRTGPILSTIHGAKGQEAEHVVLALSRAAGTNTVEEARILFVAATRARTSLSVAAARPVFGDSDTGRLWSRWRETHARIEIGVDGDVDVERSAFSTQEDPSLTDARQQALWRLSDTAVPVRCSRTDAGWDLIAEGGAFDGQNLGFLSSKVSADLRVIGRARHGGAVPGSSLHGLFVVGARTVVHLVPGAGPRFGLAPVVAGLANVWFNPTAAVAHAGATA
jgi:DNA helicase-2/ATP-dependent DNA helicase PcrA